MKEYVSNSAAKAIQRCLAIKQLRGIKPKAMRQLYSLNYRLRRLSLVQTLYFISATQSSPAAWGTSCH